MSDKIKIKFCGLTHPADIEAANALGVDMIGFNFYKESPRALGLEQAALLARAVDEKIARVALLVDGDDALIENALAATSAHYLQLHGHETPERCAEIAANTLASIIKVLPAEPASLARARDYEPHVAGFLFDTPPKQEVKKQFGGSGYSFDWSLLTDFTSPRFWGIAGGLTPDNVGEAIAISGARWVDVASGIEKTSKDKTKIKDPARMAEFVAAARKAD